MIIRKKIVILQNKKGTKSPFFVNIFVMEEAILSRLQTILPKGLFTVKVKTSKQNNNITVFMDGDYGVSIEDCGKVSRELENWLAKIPEVPDNFTLNVSSAGLSEPLVYLRQFKKNVNRNLSVHYEGNAYKGTLVYVDNEKIWLTGDKENHQAFYLSLVENAQINL